MTELEEAFPEFAAFTREQDRKPIGFVLIGERRIAPEEEGGDVEFVEFREQFTCLPVAPAIVLQKFSLGSGYIELINGLLLPEERVRFGQLIDSSEFLIHAETVEQVANHLVGVYTGRPTPRSASSQGGPQNSGDTSPDLPASEDSD